MDLDIALVKDVLDILARLSIFVTLPLALLQYYQSSRKERVEVAERAYREVDQRFVGYLDLAIRHPRLDGYSSPRETKLDPPLTADEREQQRLLYTVLTNVFENAYRQYESSDPPRELLEFRERQWPGWKEYIERFLSRPAYRAVWQEIHDEYDKPFAEFLDALQLDVAGRSSQKPGVAPVPPPIAGSGPQ